MNATTTKKQETKVAPTKTPISTEDAANVFNEVAVQGEAAISESEAFNHLESVPDAAFQEQTGEYLSFEKKGPGVYNFIFDGFTTLNLQGKQTKAAMLRDKENQSYVCSAAVLVSTCERLQRVPEFIRVIFEGEMVKSAKGEYAKLRVLTLPAPK